MQRIARLVNIVAFSAVFSCGLALAQVPSRTVEVRDHQLVIDGKNQPQLFGAEVQYFRLRGGYGPNVPREKVLELWNRTLDQFVQAKMNAISFYIPWDFHEYAEGKFDFTGTVDNDNDGRADYPSRDLKTFFQLIADRGITRIMVRPGPYINAEWGFLGFGAIPSWFHDKFPNSHMRTPYGLRSKLYDYHNPDLIKATQTWFKTLHQQVLKDQMGVGKPIVFLQLDNETNYQWQSIYNHDFGRATIARYQQFLKENYQDLEALNRVHGRSWDRWTQIQPPTFQGRSVIEDRDWYRFADDSIYTYLGKVRGLWQSLGVGEPSVLFTLAESYNAVASGLFPQFEFRNKKNFTGLMTVNLYPKMVEEADRPLLNYPFKADLDVKAADEANDSYFGSRQEWAMGPEIQGGWWKGTDVSPEARQQTYLTVLGHGLKAFFVYYFNEGQNWDVEWSYNKIAPLYEELRRERRLENIQAVKLPEDFWNELQARSDRRILVGFDVRRIMKLGPLHDTELFFDAPLDGQAQPRNHYFNLKKIGELVIAPYQDVLARAVAVHDSVALVKDDTQHLPVKDPSLPYFQAAADWTAGLLGFTMNADMNPRILHGDLSDAKAFEESQVLLHLDTGSNDPRTLGFSKQAFAHGQMIVNFLADAVPKSLGIQAPAKTLFPRAQGVNLVSAVPLTYHLGEDGQLKAGASAGTITHQILSSTPVYAYDMSAVSNSCQGILFWQDQVVGYRCQIGGGTVVQVGAHFFEDYNSNNYAKMPTVGERRSFLKALAKEAGVQHQLELSANASQVVAFARRDPQTDLLWITIKTGSLVPQTVDLKINSGLLGASLVGDKYSVRDLLGEQEQTLSRDTLIKQGFRLTLTPSGSAVFAVKPILQQ